jgi:hypothetical protein
MGCFHREERGAKGIFEEDTREAPHVSGYARPSFGVGFWRTIPYGHYIAIFYPGLLLANGGSEVGYDSYKSATAVDDQDVLRFQIAMNDTIALENDECRENVLCECYEREHTVG